MRVVWPFFNIDPSEDTSPAAGIQIDLVLRSSVLPGSRAVLTVQGETGDPVEHPEPALADQDGLLVFSGVTVPVGRVLLAVAVENECGEVESSRRPYVWDGLGLPICELDLGVEPAVVEEIAPLSVLRAEHDADPEAPGVQLQVAVNAGRPDMTVSLFALDQSTSEQEVLSQESGDDLTGEFPITLDEGEHALRAICEWPPAELRPSSPTLHLLVDTQSPDCQLVAPTSRVTAADDLDPDSDGVQFELRGTSAAADVAGRSGLFTVQDGEFEGSEVDGEGETAATATIFLDPPGAPQMIGFRITDAAGNPCEDSVTFD